MHPTNVIRFETIQPPRIDKNEALDSMHQAVATMHQAVDGLYGITRRVRALRPLEPRKSKHGGRR